MAIITNEVGQQIVILPKVIFQVVKEMVEIATDKRYNTNNKEKHREAAAYVPIRHCGYKKRSEQPTQDYINCQVVKNRFF